jgi:hypothetical protein
MVIIRRWKLLVEFLGGFVLIIGTEPVEVLSEIFAIMKIIIQLKTRSV